MMDMAPPGPTIFVRAYVGGVLERGGVHMVRAGSQPEYKVNTPD